RPSVEEFLEDLRGQSFYHNQIIEEATQQFEPTPAHYGNLTASVNDSVWTAFSELRGLVQLYSHQVEAIDYILQGHNVVISTATASGKSAIYQIPILQMLLNDPHSTILLVFPTKALAQDQATILQQLFDHIPLLHNKIVSTLDGDTPKHSDTTNISTQSERQWIRSNASVILTNPDTLHYAMLPNTKGWIGFWERLKLVVIDELHIYQGHFGQHLSHILSRLQRFSSPQFITCSATTSNPQQHMQKLTSCSDIRLIYKDGSPHGSRTMILWDSQKDIHNMEHSVNFNDVANIAVRLLVQNMRTIVFCKYRQTCELIFREINDCIRMQPELHGLQKQVMSYRGGYTAKERRQIEHQLFSGLLRMVVATSALELGIDVGSLDAVVMVGVPPSSASLWQQTGRAGRKQQSTLAIVVANASPFDRQALINPRALFAHTFAPAAIATESSITTAHLHCAAFELPITVNCDEFVQRLGINSTTELTVNPRGLLWDAPWKQWCCALELKPWPSLKTPIRTVQQTEWTVVLAAESNHSNSPMLLLEKLDSWHALFTLYEGGIFLHRGQTYSIDLVDPDNHVAVVSDTDVTWFTRPRDRQDAVPTAVDKSMRLSTKLSFNYGSIDITTTVFGYKRVDARSKRVLEIVGHNSPSITTSTRGIWIDIPLCVVRNISAAGYDIEATIHGAQHALIIIIATVSNPCVAMTDLGTECKSPLAKRSKIPRLVVYEKSPCSNGPTLRALSKAQSIFTKALGNIEKCLCKGGCTNCI
ncbi:DEAD-domain-containing protein, partial [Coemansia reversa NRRL 1564]